MKQAVRALLGGAVLLSGLIPGPFMPRHTQAMMAMCRSDVSIRLHSSATLTLSVSIADSVADVRQVTYSVHIPAGQRVRAISWTGAQFKGKKNIQVFADNSAGAYDTDAVVTTRHARVAVTANTRLWIANHRGHAANSMAGLSGQDLLIHLNG